ncbi:MAG: hypothetical protein Tsb0010_15720 [Parvularculaceae bacterium]
MTRLRTSQIIAFFALTALMIGLAGLSRLLPHPPNFAPIAAIALFAASLTRSSAAGFAIAALALIVSDAAIGFYDWRVMAAVYFAYALPALLGRGVTPDRIAPVRTGVFALAASVSFFLVTNFAVWAFGGLYPITAAGLGAAYTNALPFFKYTLAGDLFWTAALFGAWAGLRRILPERAPCAYRRI